jgi:hypothetical protein
MVVIVNKWNADLKVNIPFLAASAELGVVEAQWLFQVVGLAGPKIDLNLPPTKLDVETFVIAQPGLEKIISAVRDPTTKFLVSIIAEMRPLDQVTKELKASVVRSYGLLTDVYRVVAGITNPPRNRMRRFKSRRGRS